MNILHELRLRSFSDICSMFFSFVWTKIFFPHAMLIRRPFYRRGSRRSIVISKGTITGRYCRFETYNEGVILIGERCHIGDYVRITCAQSVEIGDDCFFASKILVTDSSHGIYSGANSTSPIIPPNNRVLVSSPTAIGNNVWIGENTVVLSGVTIGKGSVIGANSTVTNDIPDYTIAAGSPARPIKKYNFEVQKWENYTAPCNS